MPVAALPPIARIAAQYERTRKGIVVCRYRRVFDVHAGPSSQHQNFVFDGVYQDGALVKVKILQDEIGSSTASASQAASVVSSYEHPKPGDVFEAPWEPQYLQHYRDAESGADTIAFTAIDKSYGHGSGSFTFDAQRNVVSYSYAPTVLPKYTTSGIVSGTRGEVLPGYWAMVQETQSYRGRYAIFSGNATIKITESDFRRFPTAAAAEAFVANDRL